MTALSPLQGFTVPLGSDSPDGPTEITNLAKAVEQRVVMTFSSAAARTSAFTAAGISPAAGMLCYRADASGLNKYEYWSPSAGQWRVHGAYQDSYTVTGSAAGSAPFTGIPTYLRRISLTLRARSTQLVGFVTAGVQIGGDSAITYKSVWQFTQNGGAAGGGNLSTAATSAWGGYLPGASASAGLFGGTVIEISGWDKPSGNCIPVTAIGGFYDSASLFIHATGSGEYIGTATPNSLAVVPSAGNWDVGSSFELVGWE